MARKPLVQARVEESRKEAINNYADAEDISQSEAIRRLIDSGLAAEGYDASGSRGLLERIASRTTVTLSTVLLALGTTFLLGGYLLVQQNLIYGALVALLFGYGLIIGATIALGAATVAQIALSRPLRGLIINVDGETA